MPGDRTPRQVAERAMILGAIALRASLEVTSHPRVVEISGGLLRWLSEIGCGDEIDPIERELLATPLGQLSDSQRIDANWAGEEAAFFCWTLNLGPPLEETSPANQSNLVSLMRIGRPEAAEILQSAALRDRKETVEMCRHLILVLSILRESRIEPPARDIVRRLTVQKLNEVGLTATEHAVKRASEAVSRMTPQAQQQVAGLYFVRGHAAEWFLSDQSRYFG
jgi:hypothetical protein